MKITALREQVKNPNRISVFVDEDYAFSLTLDQMVEYAVKKGLELNQVELDRFKELSDQGRQKARALEWLFMRPHSVREFRDYGYRKKLDKELVQQWAEEFTRKNYLDDTAFARWFAENRMRKHKSCREITAELRSKGIEASIIDAVLSELDTADDVSLKAQVEKLRTRPRYADEQKLIAYLARKGFRYDDIKRAVSSEQ